MGGVAEANGRRAEVRVRRHMGGSFVAGNILGLCCRWAVWWDAPRTWFLEKQLANSKHSIRSTLDPAPAIASCCLVLPEYDMFDCASRCMIASVQIEHWRLVRARA